MYVYTLTLHILTLEIFGWQADFSYIRMTEIERLQFIN